MNQELLDKYIAIEQAISERTGRPFLLFAVLGERDSPNGWEIVVSVDWENASKRDIIEIIGNEMQKQFARQDYVSFSRIRVLDPSLPIVATLARQYNVQHQAVDVQSISIQGLTYEGYIIATSQRDLAVA
jgi:hypothetical protein